MLLIEKIRPVKTPKYWTIWSSWIDFYIPDWLWFYSNIKTSKDYKIFINDWKIIINPQERVKIPLWIKIKLPEWTDLQLIDKSWISSKTWLHVLWWLIDNDYCGELIICLVNTSKEQVILREWQNIIQWVIRHRITTNIEEWIVENTTERWEWWFWSTWI